MNASTVANVLLIGVAVVWILARQVQVARIKPRLLLLAPLILAYFGIRALPASTWHVPAISGCSPSARRSCWGWVCGAARPSRPGCPGSWCSHGLLPVAHAGQAEPRMVPAPPAPS
jgi:hypothetical protein